VESVRTETESGLSKTELRNRTTQEVVTAEPKWLRRLSPASKIAQAKVNGAIEDVLIGLSPVHKVGVVHRDLKPANFLIADNGEIYILDWGLAKLKGHDSDDILEENQLRIQSTVQHFTRGDNGGATMADDILGSPAFMAPEQVLDPRDTDGRADIYSMGVTWYWMLTGAFPRPPIDYVAVKVHGLRGNREEQDKAMDACYGAPLKTPRELDPSIPAPISAIIVKMMQRDRKERYQSVDEVLSDIDAFNNNLEVKAYTESASTFQKLAYYTALKITNHPLTAGAGLTLGTLGLAGAIAVPTFLAQQRANASRDIDDLRKVAEKSLEQGELNAALISLVEAREIAEDWNFDSTSSINEAIANIQLQEKVLSILAERGESIRERIINVFDRGGDAAPVVDESKTLLRDLGISNDEDLTALLERDLFTSEQVLELRETVGLVFLGQALRLATPDTFRPRSSAELEEAKELLEYAEFVLGPIQAAGGQRIEDSSIAEAGIDMAWAVYYRAAGDVEKSEELRREAFEEQAVSALDNALRGIFVLKVKGLVVSY
ncbi:MAG: phosphotransferase, partial [Bdellovibrionales bacterium]|nr:phosphotransferase [Bdellovibrionales bacterium]